MEVKIRTKQEIMRDLKKEGVTVNDDDVLEIHESDVNRFINCCKNVNEVNEVKAACKKAGWPEPMVRKINW